MKTILKQLRPLLPVIAIMFFCSSAMAQSMSDLTAAQSELQAYITSATARISDPINTAGMTQQEIDAFQAEITDAQNRLTAVEDEINRLNSEAYTTANEGGKAAVEAAYQAAIAAEAAAIAQRQAEMDAETAAMAQKVANLADPMRFGVPNTTYPNMPPPFISTGDPIQDAQIVRNWLFQNGFIDAP